MLWHHRAGFCPALLCYLAMATNSDNKNTSNVAGNSSSNPDAALDPYYIHPSENPKTVCVTSQLEGDNNYHGWEKQMQHVHATKNKF